MPYFKEDITLTKFWNLLVIFFSISISIVILYVCYCKEGISFSEFKNYHIILFGDFSNIFVDKRENFALCTLSLIAVDLLGYSVHATNQLYADSTNCKTCSQSVDIACFTRRSCQNWTWRSQKWYTNGTELRINE